MLRDSYELYLRPRRPDGLLLATFMVLNLCIGARQA
jgi:hypothetical protein